MEELTDEQKAAYFVLAKEADDATREASEVGYLRKERSDEERRAAHAKAAKLHRKASAAGPKIEKEGHLATAEYHEKYA